MDYGDKPAAAKRSLLTPPRWSLFAPPLTRMAEGKAKLRAAQKDEVLERIKDRDKDASDIGAADDERLLDELSDRRDKPD